MKITRNKEGYILDENGKIDHYTKVYGHTDIVIKVGDKVEQAGRNYFQNCKVLEVEYGCNGGILIECLESKRTKSLTVYDITKKDLK